MSLPYAACFLPHVPFYTLVKLSYLSRRLFTFLPRHTFACTRSQVHQVQGCGEPLWAGQPCPHSCRALCITPKQQPAARTGHGGLPHIKPAAPTLDSKPLLPSLQARPACCFFFFFLKFPLIFSPLINCICVLLS